MNFQKSFRKTPQDIKKVRENFPQTRFSGGVRAASLLLVLIFTSRTILCAAPDVLPGQFVGLLPSEQETLVNRFTLPESLGRLEESFRPAVFDRSKPVVFYIQDAHGQPDAQRSEAAILGYLSKNYGISKISLEGAFGPLNPGILKVLPVEEANDMMAENLVSAGELSGAELFGITRDHSGVSFHGVDGFKLYRKSFFIFRALKSQKDQIQETFSGYDSALEPLRARIFNRELLSWVRSQKAWRESMNEGAEYLRVLEMLAKSHLSMDFTDSRFQFEWPYLTRLYKAEQIQGGLRLEKAAIQAQALAKSLRGYSARSAFILNGLNEMIQKNQSNFFSSWLKNQSSFPEVRTARHFFETLYEEAKIQGAYLLEYPDFIALAGLLILREEIDARQLFLEVHKLEELLLKVLAKTPDERALLELGRDIALLKRLLNLEWAEEDLLDYFSRPADLSPESIEKRFIGLRNKKEKASLPGIKHVWLRLAVSFYQLSKKRDEVLFRKTLSGGQDSRAVVLLAGGFHAAGLKDKFKAAGVPYIVISPKIDHLDENGLYEKSMLGNVSGKTTVMDSEKAGLVKILLTDRIQNPENARRLHISQENSARLVLNAVNAAEEIYFQRGFKKEKAVQDFQAWRSSLHGMGEKLSGKGVYGVKDPRRPHAVELRGYEYDGRTKNISSPRSEVRARTQEPSKITFEQAADEIVKSMRASPGVIPPAFWRWILDQQKYFNENDFVARMTEDDDGSWDFPSSPLPEDTRKELIAFVTVLLRLNPQFQGGKNAREISFALNSEIARRYYALTGNFLSGIVFPKWEKGDYSVVREAAVAFNDAVDRLFPGKGEISLGEKRGEDSLTRTENLGLFVRRKIHTAARGMEDASILASLLNGIESGDLAEFRTELIKSQEGRPGHDQFPLERYGELLDPLSADFLKRAAGLLNEWRQQYSAKHYPAETVKSYKDVTWLELASDQELVEILKSNVDMPDERAFIVSAVLLYKILNDYYEKNYPPSVPTKLFDLVDPEHRIADAVQEQRFPDAFLLLNETRQRLRVKIQKEGKLSVSDSSNTPKERTYATDHPAPEYPVMGFPNYAPPIDTYKEAKFEAFQQLESLNLYWDRIFQDQIMDGQKGRFPQLLAKIKSGDAEALQEAVHYLALLIERMAASEIGTRELEEAGKVLNHDVLSPYKIRDLLQHIITKEPGRIIDYLNSIYRPGIRQAAARLKAEEIAPKYRRFQNGGNEIDGPALEEAMIADLKAALPAVDMLDKMAGDLLQALKDAHGLSSSARVLPFAEKNNPDYAQKTGSWIKNPDEWFIRFGHGSATAKILPTMARAGKKGLHLLEMTAIGLPVPPGDIIPAGLPLKALDSEKPRVLREFLSMERAMNRRFPLPDKFFTDYGVQITEPRPAVADIPLLFSIRSSSLISMPGISSTVINAPITDEMAEEMIRAGMDPWLVYDLQRRFLSSYAEAVHQLNPGVFIGIVDHLKNQFQKNDIESFTPEEMKELIEFFKEEITAAIIGVDASFTLDRDPMDFFVKSIKAVQGSWDTEKAKTHRQTHEILGDWRNAVIIEAVVFGNADKNSSTAIMETKGGAIKNIDHKKRAQGPSLVGGETTRFINRLEDLEPGLADEYRGHAAAIEDHFRAPQDIEVTTEKGKMHVLQARSAIESRKGEELVLTADMAFAAQGRGVSGGAATGYLIFADDLTLEDLQEEVNAVMKIIKKRKMEWNNTGVILVMNYIKPDDGAKLAIPGVVGAISPASGLSHGAISSRHYGSAFVAVPQNQLRREKENWYLGSHRLHPIETDEPVKLSGTTTLLTIDGSEDGPTSGHIYWHDPSFLNAARLNYDKKHKALATTEPVRTVLLLGANHVDRKGGEVDKLASIFDLNDEVSSNTPANRIFDAFLRQLVGEPNLSLTDIYGVENRHGFFNSLRGESAHGQNKVDQLVLDEAAGIVVINGHTIRVHEKLPAAAELAEQRAEYLIDFSNPKLSGENRHKGLRQQRLKRLREQAGLKRVFIVSGDEEPSPDSVFIGVNSRAFFLSPLESAEIPVASPAALALGVVLDVIKKEFGTDVKGVSSPVAARPATSRSGDIRFLKVPGLGDSLRKIFGEYMPETEGAFLQMVEISSHKGASSMKLSILPSGDARFKTAAEEIKALKKSKEMTDKEREKKEKAIIYEAVNVYFQNAASDNPRLQYAGAKANLNSLDGIFNSSTVVFDSQATKILENGQVEIYFHFSDMGFALALIDLMKEALGKDRPEIKKSEKIVFERNVFLGQWPAETIAPDKVKKQKQSHAADKFTNVILIGARGRIGKQLHKLLLEEPGFVPIAYVGLEDIDTFAKQLEYDAVHGPMFIEMEEEYAIEKGEGDFLVLKSRKNANYFLDPRTQHILKIPYFNIRKNAGETQEAFESRMQRELGAVSNEADLVINAAGFAMDSNDPYYNVFRGSDRIKAIVFTAPAKGAVDITVVRGVNEDQLVEKINEMFQANRILFCSAASCTTTGLGRVVLEGIDFAKVKGAEVEYVRFITHHSATPSQGNIFGAPSAGKSLRTAGDPTLSAMPEDTGANKALAAANGSVKGILSGLSHRDGNLGGSALQVSMTLKMPEGVRFTRDDVNAHFKALAGKRELAGVLAYSENISNTAQIVGDPNASIFMGDFTDVETFQDGTQVVKFWAGYDNEHGYSQAVIHFSKLIAHVQKEIPFSAALHPASVDTLPREVALNLAELHSFLERIHLEDADAPLNAAAFGIQPDRIPDLNGILFELRVALRNIKAKTQIPGVASVLASALPKLADLNGNGAKGISEMTDKITNVLAELQRSELRVPEQNFDLKEPGVEFEALVWTAAVAARKIFDLTDLRRFEVRAYAELLNGKSVNQDGTSLFEEQMPVAAKRQLQQIQARVQKTANRSTLTPLAPRVVALATYEGRIPELSERDIQALFPMGGTLILMEDNLELTKYYTRVKLPANVQLKTARHGSASISDIKKAFKGYKGFAYVILLPAGTPKPAVDAYEFAAADGFVMRLAAREGARYALVDLIGRHATGADLLNQNVADLQVTQRPGRMAVIILPRSAESRFEAIALGQMARRLLQSAA